MFKENSKMKFVILVGFLTAMIFLSACGQLVDSGSDDEEEEKKEEEQQQTLTKPSIKGKLVLPNGSTVTTESGHVTYIKDGVSLGKSLKIETGGGFVIDSMSAGTYAIAITVTENSVQHVVSTVNILVGEKDDTNIPDLKVLPVGTLKGVMAYNTSLDASGLSLTMTNLSTEERAAFLKYLDLKVTYHKDHTISDPMIEYTMELPAGTHALTITPTGKYQEETKLFQSIKITDVAIVGNEIYTHPTINATLK